ncbi:hypothetical protein Scep_021314 [Stephania cephalantha]|uniref:Uncharacterized protein n=1 Tax=Stephania cephalantha TaxID=152367 RepID=A0AAP0F367_9MAGN
MGNLLNKEPPPPMVLVPPLFDFPPMSARVRHRRMLESSYDVLFGKMALKCLFEDYFEEAGHFSSRIMLKPVDDPNVDLIATVSGPLDHKPEEKIAGNALFRWQRDVNNPNTFMDLFVSTSNPILRLRSCAYHAKYGFGAFGIFPFPVKNRVNADDYGVVGLRYGTTNLSIGATLMPLSNEFPKSAWLVSRIGRLTTGVQYKPSFGSKNLNYDDIKNWSCAIGYGLGAKSPLSPSFNFAIELARGSQWILLSEKANRILEVDIDISVMLAFEGNFSSLFIFMTNCFVLSACCGPKTGILLIPFLLVKNPFEGDEVVGITNYIDFGFELETRVDTPESSSNLPESTFQIAASWQANKNLLLKGKAGPFSSSLALAFKSWWKPSFTFNVSAVRDRKLGQTSFGFGIRIEDLREASYQRADPNYVMLTPSKEHLAEGIHWKSGKRPMLQSDVDSGNFEQLPKELRPTGKIL